MHFGPVERELIVVFVSIRFTNILIRSISIHLITWVRNKGIPLSTAQTEQYDPSAGTMSVMCGHGTLLV